MVLDEIERRVIQRTADLLIHSTPGGTELVATIPFES